MLDMYNLEDYGFIPDDRLFELGSIFSNYSINEMHIDIYSNDPYILFSRTIEKNVASTLQDDRLVVKQKNGTVIVDVPMCYIEQCMVKKYHSTCCQVIFSVLGICYKMLVIL